MVKKLVLIAISLFLFYQPVEAFDKVVIWGHKKPSHTHCFIHYGFFKAFNYLGYPTFWFDDDDNVEDFDFSHTLFLTEGQADHHIPIRDDCRYILHNCNPSKYQEGLSPSHWFFLQVYTDDVLELSNAIKVEPFVYTYVGGKIIFIPWATDLLPDEIEVIKCNLPQIIPQDKVYWVGTIGEGTFGNLSEIAPFKRACKENEIRFIHILPGNASFEENVQYIQESYLAPTIVGEYQKSKGYIPCRIFKNISYGAMGLTNSKQVYELFEGQIVYNPDTYQLFYDAVDRMQTFTREDLFASMDFVKTRHTYLNRIQVLLNFLEEIECFYTEE